MASKGRVGLFLMKNTKHNYPVFIISTVAVEPLNALQLVWPYG